MFCHDDFENEEVYCVKRWVKVNAEGQPEHLFEVQQQNEIRQAQQPNLLGEREADAVDVEADIFRMGNQVEDIAQMRRLIFGWVACGSMEF